MVIGEMVAMQLPLFLISALEVSSEEDVLLKVVTAEDFPVLNRFCAVAFSRQARTGL